MKRQNRRQFLANLAAAGIAGGCLTGASAAAATAGRKRRMISWLDCGAIGLRRVSQTEAIELAHQYGFEAADPHAEDLGKLTDSQLGELVAQMKSKGVVFGAAKLPVQFRRDQSEFLSGMKKLPAVAGALKRAGVDRMMTWIPPSHAQLTYRQNFRRHVDRLRQVAGVLGDHGLRLGLEYVGPKTSWSRSRYPFVHTMAEAKELIAEIGTRNVGLVLDSWHWYHAGERRADILSLKGTDVIAADVDDAPAGVPKDQMQDLKRELPLATGVIDLHSFLSGLNEIGFDGPVRAEPFNAALRKLPREKAVARTAAAMKKALALID